MNWQAILDQLWTTKDVADYLGVQMGTVSTYRERGQMVQPVGKLGKTWVWDKQQVREWAANRPRAAIRSIETTEPL